MKKDAPKLHDDRDGVRVLETGERRRAPAGLLTAATLALVAAAYVLYDTGRWTEPDRVVAPVAAPVARQPAAPGHPVRKPAAAAKAARAGREEPIADRETDQQRANPATQRITDPVADAEPSDDQPSSLESFAREMIQTLRSSGETGGIAVFPPPGTKPVKTGIIVPETFDLPEGYVRYHQVTDDGRPLAPILMYSPDYELVDDAGNPIPVPDDGIVPPDKAPAGLPVRMLEVPNAPHGSR